MNKISPKNQINENEEIDGSAYKSDLRFIITHSTGQLGNQLIMFAHFIAFALANNYRVANFAFYNYANLFESTSKDVFCRYPPEHSFIKYNFVRKPLYNFVRFIANDRVRKRLNFLRTEKIIARGASKEFRLDAPGLFKYTEMKKIIFADGFHFRDYLNFLKYTDEIKKYFVPLAAHRDNIANLIERANKACDVLIGVHVRRGDYKYFKNGKFFYEIDAYLDMIYKVEKLFPDKRVGFLVCSDEMFDKNKFHTHNIFFGTGNIIEDMYSFACCDYLIGPPSSYTRWASFYGDVPLYMRKTLHEEISTDKFLLYEERVHRHMKYAPNYPRYDET